MSLLWGTLLWRKEFMSRRHLKSQDCLGMLTEMLKFILTFAVILWSLERLALKLEIIWKNNNSGYMRTSFPRSLWGRCVSWQRLTIYRCSVAVLWQITGLFLEVALRAVGSTWKSGGLCLYGEQCCLSWWQQHAKNRPKHQKLETAGVQKVPRAWKSCLLCKLQYLQFVDLGSGQNSTILSQKKKSILPSETGYFLHQSAVVYAFLIPFQGWFISNYLLKIEGSTEAILTKWLKVLLVAQGLFLLKKILSQTTTDTENLIIWQKEIQEQVTIGISRSTC